MARAIYYVLRAGDQWKIRHNEKDYFYPTQAAAMQSAVYTANECGKKGIDAQVLVQGRDGKWQTEWTYGHDPYPPRG